MYRMLGVLCSVRSVCCARSMADLIDEYDVGEVAAFSDAEAEAAAEEALYGANEAACTKHCDCMYKEFHPGRCVWLDPDLKVRKWIPYDDAGWNKANAMDVDTKPTDSHESVSRIVKRKATAVTAATASDPFAAALAEQEKAEQAAKKLKTDAAAKVSVAAQKKKEELRRNALTIKRDAAKVRQQAEKRARELEADAEEAEKAANKLSQDYP